MVLCSTSACGHYLASYVLNNKHCINSCFKCVHIDEYLYVAINWFSKKIKQALCNHDMKSLWISDSGATKHMTRCKDWMCNNESYNAMIKMRGDNVMHSDSIGNVSLTVIDLHGNSSIMQLSHVLYVPVLSVNLFSIICAPMLET